jgi:transposase
MSQANPLESELRRANEILKAASVFFATELDADRPK